MLKQMALQQLAMQERMPCLFQYVLELSNLLHILITASKYEDAEQLRQLQEILKTTLNPLMHGSRQLQVLALQAQKV